MLDSQAAAAGLRLPLVVNSDDMCLQDTSLACPSLSANCEEAALESACTQRCCSACKVRRLQ